MEQPLPDNIATRKFAQRLLGLDAMSVYQFLAEIAAAVERLRANESRLTAERDDARAALKVARAQVEAAAQRTASLEARVGSHQEREGSIVQALVLAENTRHEIQAHAQAEADKTVANAQVDATAIVKCARQTAAKLVEEARELAKHTLEGAKRVAEAKSALAGVESRLLIEESGALAARIGLLTRQQTATLTAQVEAIVAEHGASADVLQQPERLGELKSELDQAMKLVIELETKMTSQESKPDSEGERQQC
jgi:cell division septum initiation protein DivIVA